MSRKRGPDEDASPLARALRPHVEALVAAAAERDERALAEASRRIRRLDEAELMTLIFGRLELENPRVCVGIDFDRLAVIEEDSGDSGSIDARAERPPVPSPPTTDLPTPPVAARPNPDDWVGRGWVDEVRAVDRELLDRPELDAKQRALLERASGRALPTLNLRRLERQPALAHLELFVSACRGRGVRHIRVVTGKGIESRAEPVIKRAVLGWCLDAGLACSPEIDVHGEWGALVIELVKAAG